MLKCKRRLRLKRKKILLFSHDPGGSNTIIPLVSKLRGNGFDVSLFGKGPALSKYEYFNLCGMNIEQFVYSLNIEH